MRPKKNHLLLALSVLSMPMLAWSDSHHPQIFLQQIAGSKDEGSQIVDHFCANCHAPNPVIPLGAPRMGKINDWKHRTQSGLSMLLKHTDEGLNAMPPRGGCFECSDEQLRLAILALLPDNLKDDVLKTK